MIALKRISTENKSYVVEQGRLISSALLLTDKKRFLVCLSQKSGVYDLPKGKVEKGETPEEACVREVLEETNLDISRASLVNLGKKSYEDTKDIQLFALVVKKLPPIERMKSREFFHTPYTSQPDMGDYRYIHFDQVQDWCEKKSISPRMARFLKEEAFKDASRLPYQSFSVS